MTLTALRATSTTETTPRLKSRAPTRPARAEFQRPSPDLVPLITLACVIAPWVIAIHWWFG